MGTPQTLLSTVMSTLYTMMEYVTMQVVPKAWIQRKERERKVSFSLRHSEYRGVYRALSRMFHRRRKALGIEELNRVGSLLEGIVRAEDMDDFYTGLDLLKAIAQGKGVEKEKHRAFFRYISSDASKKKSEEEEKKEMEKKEKKEKKEMENEDVEKEKEKAEGEKEKADVKEREREKEEDSRAYMPKRSEPKEKSYKIVGVSPGLIPNETLRRMYRQGLKIKEETRMYEDLKNPLKNLPSEYYAKSHPYLSTRPYMTYSEDTEYLQQIEEEKDKRKTEDVMSEISQKIDEERSRKAYKTSAGGASSVCRETSLPSTSTNTPTNTPTPLSSGTGQQEVRSVPGMGMGMGAGMGAGAAHTPLGILDSLRAAPAEGCRVEDTDSMGKPAERSGLGTGSFLSSFGSTDKTESASASSRSGVFGAMPKEPSMFSESSVPKEDMKKPFSFSLSESAQPTDLGTSMNTSVGLGMNSGLGMGMNMGLGMDSKRSRGDSDTSQGHASTSDVSTPPPRFSFAALEQTPKSLGSPSWSAQTPGLFSSTPKPAYETSQMDSSLGSLDKDKDKKESNDLFKSSVLSSSGSVQPSLPSLFSFGTPLTASPSSSLPSTEAGAAGVGVGLGMSAGAGLGVDLHTKDSKDTSSTISSTISSAINDNTNETSSPSLTRSRTDSLFGSSSGNVLGALNGEGVSGLLTHKDTSQFVEPAKSTASSLQEQSAFPSTSAPESGYASRTLQESSRGLFSQLEAKPSSLESTSGSSFFSNPQIPGTQPSVNTQTPSAGTSAGTSGLFGNAPSLGGLSSLFSSASTTTQFTNPAGGVFQGQASERVLGGQESSKPPGLFGQMPSAGGSPFQGMGVPASSSGMPMNPAQMDEASFSSPPGGFTNRFSSNDTVRKRSFFGSKK
ncbi:hypothetical protein NECID01_1611 [Nematocida sp. AWRm77]|nr:hypothetical protein NECID01_1611 [Nematocida sp. AWRm77]